MNDQDTTKQLPPAQPPPEPPQEEPRRLTRSRDDRVIAGVAAGLAVYFKVDPVIVRIAFAVSIFFGGLGLIAYVALALFVPTAAGPDGEPEAAPVERSRLLAVGVGVGVVVIALSWGIFDGPLWGNGFFFSPALFLIALAGGAVLIARQVGGGGVAPQRVGHGADRLRRLRRPLDRRDRGGLGRGDGPRSCRRDRSDRDRRDARGGGVQRGRPLADRPGARARGAARRRDRRGHLVRRGDRGPPLPAAGGRVGARPLRARHREARRRPAGARLDRLDRGRPRARPRRRGGDRRRAGGCLRDDRLLGQGRRPARRQRARGRGRCRERRQHGRDGHPAPGPHRRGGPRRASRDQPRRRRHHRRPLARVQRPRSTTTATRWPRRSSAPAHPTRPHRPIRPGRRSPAPAARSGAVDRPLRPRLARRRASW